MNHTQNKLQMNARRILAILSVRCWRHPCSNSFNAITSGIAELLTRENCRFCEMPSIGRICKLNRIRRYRNRGKLSTPAINGSRFFSIGSPQDPPCSAPCVQYCLAVFIHRYKVESSVACFETAGASAGLEKKSAIRLFGPPASSEVTVEVTVWSFLDNVWQAVD